MYRFHEADLGNLLQLFDGTTEYHWNHLNSSDLLMMETLEFRKLKQPIALVVDDEPLILMDTADMFADEGYAIVEASTADEAWDFLDKHSSLQLLFTDVQTPGSLDGFELARKVAERWPHICVIIASGAARPGPGDIPPNATFIAKPFTAELIHDVLKEKGSQHG